MPRIRKNVTIKPTIQELQDRIEILEKKLQEQETRPLYKVGDKVMVMARITYVNGPEETSCDQTSYNLTIVDQGGNDGEMIYNIDEFCLIEDESEEDV